MRDLVERQAGEHQGVGGDGQGDRPEHPRPRGMGAGPVVDGRAGGTMAGCLHRDIGSWWEGPQRQRDDHQPHGNAADDPRLAPSDALDPGAHDDRQERQAHRRGRPGDGHGATEVGPEPQRDDHLGDQAQRALSKQAKGEEAYCQRDQRPDLGHRDDHRAKDGAHGKCRTSTAVLVDLAADPGHREGGNQGARGVDRGDLRPGDRQLSDERVDEDGDARCLAEDGHRSRDRRERDDPVRRWKGDRMLRLEGIVHPARLRGTRSEGGLRVPVPRVP